MVKQHKKSYQKVHKKDKPFKCGCAPDQYAFLRLKQLKRHWKQHSEEELQYLKDRSVVPKEPDNITYVKNSNYMPRSKIFFALSDLAMKTSSKIQEAIGQSEVKELKEMIRYNFQDEFSYSGDQMEEIIPISQKLQILNQDISKKAKSMLKRFCGQDSYCYRNMLQVEQLLSFNQPVAQDFNSQIGQVQIINIANALQKHFQNKRLGQLLEASLYLIHLQHQIYDKLEPAWGAMEKQLTQIWEGSPAIKGIVAQYYDQFNMIRFYFNEWNNSLPVPAMVQFMQKKREQIRKPKQNNNQ